MMQKNRRVVITGLGMVTPLGHEVQQNWSQALAGRSGIRKVPGTYAAKSPVQAAGCVPDQSWRVIMDTFPENAAAEGERRTLFALWAAESAFKDSGLKTGVDNDRRGVVLAAGLGINRPEDIAGFIGTDRTFDYMKFHKDHARIHRESMIRNHTHRPAALIAKNMGFGAENATITTACASATQAIGTAYRTVCRGEADVMAAGGADSMINPVGLVFFVLLKAAAMRADDPEGLCRPFDRKRSGLVMGEGAGMAILEEEGHARSRGARIYAEVAGYASSMDAWKVTAPDPAGSGAVRSMENALKDASMDRSSIDYINAHGTGTKLNDKAETMSIRKVFQDHADKLAVNSTKSMTGHLIAASGGPEFIFTALSVQSDMVHPTLNLHNPDPACDLDYVAGAARHMTVRAAISNSFGFGGQNASIIVKKYRET